VDVLLVVQNGLSNRPLIALERAGGCEVCEFQVMIEVMRFSIITPVLNRRELLREAIASLDAQGQNNVEHIVVDGGSVDGTLEMLGAHPNIIVVQDRRRGLYDAINLGVEHGSGDVIGLLNSDDTYGPGALRAVERAFVLNPHADAVCGAAELFNADGVLARYNAHADLALDCHAALVGACIINARFFRRHVFERCGLFSLDFPLVADREFLVRTLVAGMVTASTDAVVYRYRSHGGSLTLSARPDQADAMRGELLRLARTIVTKADAGPELRWRARALEGRCLARSVINSLSAGDFIAAIRALVMRDGRPSLAPLFAVGYGTLDVLRIGRMGAGR
jgi:Glycosyl transferase family 2